MIPLKNAGSSPPVTVPLSRTKPVELEPKINSREKAYAWDTKFVNNQKDYAR